MKKTAFLKIELILLSGIFLYGTSSYAHSGGTDSAGCHAGTEPYHCHEPKGEANLAVAGIVVGVLVLYWLITKDDDKNNYTLKTYNSKRFYGNDFNLDSNVSLPLGTSKFRLQIGQNIDQQYSLNGDISAIRNQLYTGIEYNFDNGAVLSLTTQRKKVGMNFGFKF